MENHFRSSDKHSLVVWYLHQSSLKVHLPFELTVISLPIWFTLATTWLASTNVSSRKHLPLFRLFSVFLNQPIQIVQQINVEKSPSGIRHQDSNSRPSDYESPPLTTRPGVECSVSLRLTHAQDCGSKQCNVRTQWMILRKC